LKISQPRLRKKPVTWKSQASVGSKTIVIKVSGLLNMLHKPMKMEIYGFKAVVYRDEKWFIGEIPELHVHDQAKTLRELEDELKDAVDTAIAFSLEHEARPKSQAIRACLQKPEVLG
jgi:predicted RNase H-like HicB family nuclease